MLSEGSLNREQPGNSAVFLVADPHPLLQSPNRCAVLGGLGSWHGLTGVDGSQLRVREPSWAGAGVVAAHKEGVVCTAGHLAGLGNFNILLGHREVTGALLCKVWQGEDLRVEPHGL